jgi:hypothetical protein
MGVAAMVGAGTEAAAREQAATGVEERAAAA